MKLNFLLLVCIVIGILFFDTSYGYVSATKNVASSNGTIELQSANIPCRDVIADAPWRIESSATQIPILIIVKEASGLCGSYSLDHIEIWTGYWTTGSDGNSIWVDVNHLKNAGNEIGLPRTIGPGRENLYYDGDWYGIIQLPKSGTNISGQPYTLSGNISLRVAIISGSIFDPSTDTYLNPNFAS